MNEKRMHKRYELEVPATLRTNGKLIPASTVDLSRGGICLLADYREEIPEGIVEVIMDLSQEFRDVSLRGYVLRRQKGIGQKVAIQFTTSNSKGHSILEKFLATR